jgi:hypothetical protein
VHWKVMVHLVCAPLRTASCTFTFSPCTYSIYGTLSMCTIVHYIVHHHILPVHIQYLWYTHYVHHSCTITFPRCTYSIYGTHCIRTIRAPSYSLRAHTVFKVHTLCAPFVYHNIPWVHIQYLRYTLYTHHSCTITFPSCTYSIYGTHIFAPFVHHQISFCAPFVHRWFCSVSNDTLFKCTIYDFNTLKPIFITEFGLFCAHMRCTKRNFLCVQNAPSADRQSTAGFWYTECTIVFESVPSV